MIKTDAKGGIEKIDMSNCLEIVKYGYPKKISKYKEGYIFICYDEKENPTSSVKNSAYFIFTKKDGEVYPVDEDFDIQKFFRVKNPLYNLFI